MAKPKYYINSTPFDTSKMEVANTAMGGWALFIRNNGIRRWIRTGQDDIVVFNTEFQAQCFLASLKEKFNAQPE